MVWELIKHIELDINKNTNLIIPSNVIIKKFNNNIVNFFNKFNNNNFNNNHFNCIIGDINCQFQNVNFIFKLENSLKNTKINGFKFENCYYKFNNCVFSIKSDLIINDFILFYNNNCNINIKECIFKDLKNINIFKNNNCNIIIYNSEFNIKNVVCLEVNNIDFQYKSIIDNCNFIDLKDDMYEILENENFLITQINHSFIFIKNCIFNKNNFKTKNSFNFKNKNNIVFNNCFVNDLKNNIYKKLTKWGEIEKDNLIIGQNNYINQSTIKKYINRVL